MFISSRSRFGVVLLNNFVVDLPSPSSLSYLWNFGSMLGIFLGVQVVSGLFLSFHFIGSLEGSFGSVVEVMRDVSWGWLVRVLHANGASVFFLFLYVHVGRGIYYGSYRFLGVWFTGVVILFLSMMIAFLGYVLPWGQMSYWAATVITNLLSVVPLVGFVLVEWVWGGFSVGEATLVRFFAFHFLFPFVVLGIVLLHLFFLHSTGSNNPTGLVGGVDSIFFHSYYSVSDVFGVMVFMVGFVTLCMLFPYIFMDVENFIYYNPLVTPVHIQPEWYFLFAYAVLRSIPNSVGGVLALVMSVSILFVVPFMYSGIFRGLGFYGVLSGCFWILVFSWVILGWLGACEVDYPYNILSGILGVVYFGGFLMLMVCSFFDFVMDWL